MAEVKPSRNEVQRYAARVASEVGIPSGIFLALCNQESGFNATAQSKVGAYGVCQIMPGTAAGLSKRYSKKYGRELNFKNWEDNVLMGALYFKENLQRFEGSVKKTLAAYNAGPGAVKKYNGVPPYKETQNYVKSILAGSKKFGENTAYILNMSGSGFNSANTGAPSPEKYKRLASIVQDANNASGGAWQGIKTNRPELLEDSPEYSDYADLRKLTLNGKPLFSKGDYPAEIVKSGGDNFIGYQNGIESGVAASLYKTQNYNYDPESTETIQSLIMAFQDRYKQYSEDGEPFGMANLRYKDYEEYGLSGDNVINPMMQARVLVNEFQKAKYFFGNEDLAFHAMAGGVFSSSDGERMGWNELKDDPNRYRSEWYQSYRDEKDKKSLQELHDNYIEYRKNIV